MRFTRQWNQIKQNQKTRLNGMRHITDITGDVFKEIYKKRLV